MPQQGEKVTVLKDELKSLEPVDHIGAFLLLRKDNRILIVREVNKCIWGLPGGTVEAGEDFVAAAIREVYEETGISPKDIRVGRKVYVHKRANHIDPNHNQHTTTLTLHYFVAELTGEIDVNLSGDEQEIAEVSWVSIEEARQGVYELRDEIRLIMQEVFGK